jgi:hypothetical protein
MPDVVIFLRPCAASSRSSGEMRSAPRARLYRQYSSGSVIRPPNLARMSPPPSPEFRNAASSLDSSEWKRVPADLG